LTEKKRPSGSSRPQANKTAGRQIQSQEKKKKKKKLKKIKIF
jgi:hypothetical protein